MKVIVNGTEIIIFEGAKVIDALRMYDDNALRNVQKGQAVVLDQYGNHVNIDGALQNNSRLFVRENKQK